MDTKDYFSILQSSLQRHCGALDSLIMAAEWGPYIVVLVLCGDLCVALWRPAACWLPAVIFDRASSEGAEL